MSIKNFLERHLFCASSVFKWVPGDFGQVQIASYYQIVIGFRSMVKKNLEFLQPVACIVDGIWQVNRVEQHLLIAKSGHLSAHKS